MLKRVVLIIFLSSCLAGTLTSCKGLKNGFQRVFQGDPRKNCNHPDHGKYMKEQQQTKFKKYNGK